MKTDKLFPEDSPAPEYLDESSLKLATSAVHRMLAPEGKKCAGPLGEDQKKILRFLIEDCTRLAPDVLEHNLGGNAIPGGHPSQW